MKNRNTHSKRTQRPRRPHRVGATPHFEFDPDQLRRDLIRAEAIHNMTPYSEVLVEREVVTRWDRKNHRRDRNALRRAMTELAS